VASRRRWRQRQWHLEKSKNNDAHAYLRVPRTYARTLRRGSAACARLRTAHAFCTARCALCAQRAITPRVGTRATRGGVSKIVMKRQLIGWLGIGVWHLKAKNSEMVAAAWPASAWHGSVAAAYRL
jgi:hypothetical protein